MLWYGWKFNKFLYEFRPDLFPQGYLTDTERFLWTLFLEDLNERQEQAKRER